MLVGAWAMLVVVGLGILFDYAHAPGAPSLAPQTWPAALQLKRSRDKATLILFAHPRCPCTRASIAQLGRIVTRRRGRVSVHVVFLRPEGFPADWERTDLWRSAARLPDVAVHSDPGGRMTRAFGVSTSGQVLVYDRDGSLVFEGGITAARGHQGDNVGETIVLAILADEQAAAADVSVYGCPMSEPDCGPERRGACSN